MIVYVFVGATKNVENRGDLQQVSAELVMTRSRATAAKRAMASNATKANSAENDRSQENGVVTEVVPVPAFEPEVANPQGKFKSRGFRVDM